MTASVLVNMTAEELASSDRRQDNDKIREYKKMEAVRGNNNTASTDMFQWVLVLTAVTRLDFAGPLRQGYSCVVSADADGGAAAAATLRRCGKCRQRKCTYYVSCCSKHDAMQVRFVYATLTSHLTNRPALLRSNCKRGLLMR